MEICKQKIKIPTALKNLYCKEDALKRLSELLKATQSFPSQKEVRDQLKVLRAISDPTRLNILRLLRVRAMCVCELMEALKLRQPLISHHLRILKDSGIVEDRKQGRWIFYAIRNKKVLKLIDALDDLTEEEI
jgi:ArsR family transcriptional regulator